MQQVILSWEPSTSVNVDVQRVKIFDVNTLEEYGAADLDPSATMFSAQCPEGATVRGSVSTIRGTDEAVAVSGTVDIPLEPLQPATELMIATKQPR